jgi:ferredoxin--NADP+ reductase
VIFRSIGYRVSPLPGVPFRSDWSIIPNEAGQVVTHPEGETVSGLFVAGWAKRGPSGVIGTNKPDAVETVSTLVQAWSEGGLPDPTDGDVARLLEERDVAFVTYDDWKTLDRLEVEKGEAIGRPRVKFVNVADMLAALGK